jgi:hypothetical protein
LRHAGGGEKRKARDEECRTTHAPPLDGRD